MSKIHTVTLPDIGEGVVEGEVIEWLKNINDTVAQDEAVVVVMTDKATVELPAPYPGKIVKHYYKPGELSIKGKPLYDIELAEGSVAIPKQQAKLKEAPVATTTTTTTTTCAKSVVASTGDSLALPATRRLAKEMGVNIDLVKGSGRDGRVTDADLRSHFNKVQTPHAPVTRLPGDQIVPIIGIKNLMARKMSESAQIIPHFSYFEKVDATRLVRMRQKFKEEGVKQGIQVTYMPFLIKALCLAIKKHPQFNSSVDGGNMIVHTQYNIGVAMASPLGLIVPVLKNVQDFSLIDLIHAYEDLKKRAAANKLHPQEMKEGTITISNFGVLGEGGLWATPIINYPESAILAVNRIQKQPAVCNNEVVVRDELNLSWSFDHRIIDGDQAGAFSNYYTSLLENPASLL